MLTVLTKVWGAPTTFKWEEVAPHYPPIPASLPAPCWGSRERLTPTADESRTGHRETDEATIEFESSQRDASFPLKKCFLTKPEYMLKSND